MRRGSMPSREELEAAAGAKLADLIAPDLRALFCGINPGLYSAHAGHHFARPGNRFWPALHAAGFTERLLHPSEERELLATGFGLTNLVERATARAAELSPAELRAGRARLAEKVERYRPRAVAVLGITAYRTAWARPDAGLGPQEDLAGAQVWVLPSPSGLNAHYQLEGLAELFRQFREALDR